MELSPVGLLLIACCLVHLLQAGLMMTTVGYSRVKVSGSVLMSLLAVHWIGSLLFWAFGWGLAQGSTFGGILGVEGFFFRSGGDVPWVLRWWFHASMNSIAGCIAVSGLLGRARYAPTLVAVGWLVGVILPVMQHWTWNPAGWLVALGFRDYAGTAGIHLAGGVAALAATAVLRPRQGRFTREGLPNAQPAHNLPLSACGVAFMSLGWFGLVFGRAAEMSLDSATGIVLGDSAICLAAASSAGAFAAMLFAWGRYGKPDITLTLNGAIAGLVGVGGVADALSPLYALVIGGVSGVLAVFGASWLDKWQWDDIGGIIPVHAFCGAWGVLATGIFHGSEGVLFGGGFRLLGIQFAGAVAVALAAGVAAWFVVWILRRFAGLRASPDAEHEGLDHTEHANEAYPEFQTAEFK